jgi:signal transduction histidine kinase
MTGNFLPDWATLAVSIFNTILLLWLGLTVLLNSERRSLGVWIAGGGLLMSSMFFLAHSAILGLGPLKPEAGMNIWWRTGWIPVVSMPFAWYLVMLWYASYWDDPQSPIHLRHQVPLILTTLLAISTVGLVLLFNALPTFNQLIQLDLGGVLSVGGIPVLMVVYPGYLVMCIGFSLDVLLHPGKPGRLMGQLARQRARPWLMLATLSLLLVSILVGVIIIWGIKNVNQGITVSQFALMLSVFDLVIDLLIAITILSVGQAIVSYEIFTGKVLPRQGLKRYWKLAMIFSLAFGMIISWALLHQLEPIYLLLLSIILMTGIYAVFSWRSFIEQERFIKTLQPFFASQHLYDQLVLQNSASIDIEIAKPFIALCKDILGVKQAFLIPLGIFGPLVGSTISYPTRIDSDGHEELIQVIRHALSGCSGFAPILLPDSKFYSRNSFALSLWSERGMVGAMVLDEKQNGSLFTQEEIEIARTVGERLIDSKAGNELAKKLMELQRSHLSETKVIDQHTRRTLHDDILPRLQSTMIKLSSKAINSDSAIYEMGEIHRQLTAIMRDLPTIQEPELAERGLIEALQMSIENEFRSYFNLLTWKIDDQVDIKTRSIPVFAADVFYHAAREAVRNAARHGRQADPDHPLNLHITISWEDKLVIGVQDDGMGFDANSKNGGNRGQGLALHSTLMAVVGGSLAVESIPNKSTHVILKYPA